MLTPEQAREALAAARHTADDRSGARHARLLAAIATLSPGLRVAAYGLIGRDAAGQVVRAASTYTPDYHIRAREAQDAAMSQLEAMDDERRRQVFAAFFPRIAEAVELTWRHLRAEPYTRSGAGVMRAPNRPEATRQSRYSWLQQMISAVEPYDADVAWLARHAGYMGYFTHTLGSLFAAVIDSGGVAGDEVFGILTRTARGEDETGMMGAHVPYALLAAARPDGWAEVERLLLAAQREEGVRQMILGAASGAHPLAFQRIAETILSYDLIRFTAVTAAVAGWLGVPWEVGQAAAAGRALAQLAHLLGDAPARRAALDGDGEALALALWALATEDVAAALPHAIGRLHDADPSRRYAAARFLAASQLPEAREPLLAALDDPSPYVAGEACGGLNRGSAGATPGADDFERIEATLAHLPAKPAPDTQILWIAPATGVTRESMAGLLLAARGERDPARLIPHLESMSPYTRASAAKLLATRRDDPACRAALLNLLGDRASWVRSEALKALE
ncbi:MAG: hypothetical protein KGO05_03705, partial [Chloroflexota bacterium]|nr:hypothetical protein [Chloroflexota bacterium]